MTNAQKPTENDAPAVNDERIRLKQQGYALLEYDNGPVHSYPYDAPWLTDATFSRLYDQIRNNTLVDRVRCYSLYLIVQQIRNVPGDILEVGTWRGGTAGLLATLEPARTIFAADTFRGVVKSSAWEHYQDQAHDDTSEELVRTFLETDLALTNCRILTGIFPEDTGSQIHGRQLALVYLDVDVYQSTKDAFEYVWDQLSVHGIVVFDDYGMINACEGISRFVSEIQGDDDKLFISNLNGQAYIVKLR